jgi:hypothetical protein
MAKTTVMLRMSKIQGGCYKDASTYARRRMAASSIL